MTFEHTGNRGKQSDYSKQEALTSHVEWVVVVVVGSWCNNLHTRVGGDVMAESR